MSTLAYLRKPLSISAMSVLLDLATYDIIRILVLLQAIVHVPGRDDLPVTMFHTSLRDFLVDKNRSGHLHSPESHHTFLVHQCLKILFDSRSTMNEECNKYAIIYWPLHLTEAMTVRNNEFVSGPAPVLNSDEPYRPLGPQHPTPGEGPIVIHFYGGEWMTMETNYARVVDKIDSFMFRNRFSDIGLPQLSILDDHQIDLRWTRQIGSSLGTGQFCSRKTCSFKDIVQGLCISVIWTIDSKYDLYLKQGRPGFGMHLRSNSHARTIEIDRV